MPEKKPGLLTTFLSNQGLIAKVLRQYRIDSVDMEDMIQETFVRALEAEKRTTIEQPKNFLAGIARNVARRELEQRARYTNELVEEFDPNHYHSDNDVVEGAAATRQQMHSYWAAVQTLPPQCQKVFVLKHVYGASHKEIAKKLDIAISTVEKHVALGLRRCREKILAEQQGTEAQVKPLVVPGHNTGDA